MPNNKACYKDLSGVEARGVAKFLLKECQNVTQVRRKLARSGIKMGRSLLTSLRDAKAAPRKTPKAGKAKTPHQKTVEARRKIVKEACDETVERVNGTKTYVNTSASLVQAFYKKKTKKNTAPSVRTIRRDVKSLGYVRRRRPSRPHRGTQADRDTRLSFATDMLEEFRRGADGDAKPKGMIFSDEHHATSNHHGPQYAFVPQGTAHADILPVDKADWRNITHVTIWGAIGVGFKSKLINVSKLNGGRLTSKEYKMKCLSPHREKLKAKDITFMHDGARYHTAKEIRNYCAKQGIALLLNWPARSPDLNPIEKVWAYLDQAVDRKFPGGAADADTKFAHYEAVWNEIPQETFNNYVMSFQGELERVKKNKGD